MESPSALPGGGSARRVAPSLAPLSLLSVLVAGLLGACNLGGGEQLVSQGAPGSEQDKPGGGGTYFVDDNEGGGASRLRIEEMFWGRLVDVYDAHQVDDPTDPNFGEWLEGTLAFEDFAINESFLADTTEEDFKNGIGNYLLLTNPITLKTRLVIRRVKGAEEPYPGAGTFLDLLAVATASMPPIEPKNDDGSGIEPFSFIARNAVLVIRVNDLLDDSQEAEDALLETVRVKTGYRPTTPFAARLRFDPNHGGVAGGAFHSTRVLVDMTISEFEAASMSQALGVNVVGLPASLPTTGQPNTSVRIPSREDFGSGQFTILRSYSGKPMTTSLNGPVDWESPTLDIVRAMRAGGPADESNGFMLDQDPPRIVGGWQFSVTTANHDPGAETPGRDFVFDIDFATACMTAPREGDILSLATGSFLEVTEDGVDPDPATGEVPSVRVRLLTGDPVTGSLNLFLGLGIYMASYSTDAGVDDSCWVTFTPLPNDFPAVGVSPNAQIIVRFNEPMDPDSVNPFDTVFVVRGDTSTERYANNTVVGGMDSSPSLKDHTFTALLPFAHAGDVGNPDPYYIDVVTGPNGVSDLAGNTIADVLPRIGFTIDPLAPAETNGGLVLRFAAVDEYDFAGNSAGDGFQDIRGQMFYNLDRELIEPRGVQRISYPADYTNTVVSNFVPVPGGVQTPLIPLGSKLMALWRYVDLGMNVRDESRFNLDVEGLNWAPPGGQLISDYFELFEMRLSHSIQLPDETIDPFLGIPRYPNSGLFNAPSRFDSNILSEPSDQVTVHNRALGYRINPIDLFLSSSGTQMVPFPLNRSGAVPVDFIWRDTAVLGVGGFNGGGVPMDIEASFGLDGPAGSLYPATKVPTIGLPLLMEFRCFPSDSGLGVNSLSVGQAIATIPPTIIPYFRVFSSGGRDSNYNDIVKNPDLENVPTGGYNPTGVPTAPGDNLLYIGQLDSVIRVSRVHTVWINTQIASPDYVAPVISPLPDDQPEGTAILVEFRGASGFSTTDDHQYDGSFLDAYGDVPSTDSVTFFGDGAWTSDIDEVDGAAFVQVRFTFINNTETLRNAELDSFGLAYGTL